MNNLNYSGAVEGNERKSLFKKLYLENYRLLFEFVSLGLDYRNPLEAESIVRDIFYEAWRYLDDLTVNDDSRNWLLRKARKRLVLLIQVEKYRELKKANCNAKADGKVMKSNAQEVRTLVNKSKDDHERIIFKDYQTYLP